VTGSGRRPLALLSALFLSGAAVHGAAPGAARSGRGEPATGERSVATERAVVDFSALAAEEARVGRPPSQRVPQPEVDTPVDVPIDDELRAILPKPEAALAPAPLPETPALLSPAPADNFLALPDNNTSIPPDTHGAVGPNHLMVTLNTQVRVQTKAGGTMTTVSLNGFWSSVNGGSGSFDPRVAYDQMANRWIVTACDDPQAASSGLLVGVSQTGDPTGLWNLYKFDADATNTLWHDYPSVGFTKDWIVVQVNAFTIAGNTFSESHVFAFDKANLYSGGAGLHTLFKLTGIGSTQVPAVTYDSTLATAFLVSTWNSGAGALRIFTITGPVGTETFTPSNFVVSPQTWNPSGPDAPQAGLPDLIRTNDARMQNVIFRNGALWAAQTVFPNSGPARASVQWWQFLPSGSILQRARIDDPAGNVFYAFPSIAVSVNEDVLVGYSRFSATQFASADYSFRFRNDPANTLQSDLVFKAGEGAYEKYFTGVVNRWGDYSNTVVDPANDRDLWTIQEYAATPVGFPPPPPNTGRWGTWWARVATTPTLSIDDVTVPEGNSGTVNATFTVTLSRPVLQTVKVDFATANGTALVLDGDYVAASGQLTFNPGETSKPVTVVVNGDLKFEPDETFVVDLTNPQNATLLNTQGQGTIQNDDPLPSITVNDASVVEGNTGTTAANFTVSLSNPSSQTVTVAYTTPGVTAFSPVDFVAQSGILTFNPGVVTQPVSVIVNGDVLVEPDETFQVALSGPTNATFARSAGLGTIVNDDLVPDAVQFFTVTSKPGQNRLEWVNPTAGPFFGTVIRFNVSTPMTSDCTLPTAATGAGSGAGGFGPQIGPGLGGRDFLDHMPLADDTAVCYTAFAQKDAGGTTFSPGLSNSGRPFAPGPIQWAMSMGIFSMIPPGNGLGVVHAVAQDGSLHAMVKGNIAEGGTWPTTPLFPMWMPQRMAGPSQGRPSGIPVPTALSTRTLFLTSQDGFAHAFNAETGVPAWTAALAPLAALQAPPAGVFIVFGGTKDFLFVGTREATGSKFYALRTTNGTQAWVFDGVSAGFGRIGAISGQAAVDLVTKRVYFASRAFGAAPDNRTVWCVDLETGAGLWAAARGDIDTGASLAGSTLWVGTNDPKVKKIDTVAPNEGVELWSFPIPPAQGPAKGYVAVDRLSGDSFFSTASAVWALDSAGSPKWLPGGDRLLGAPSTPVFAPQDLFVYAGGGDGKLHRFFVVGGAEDTAAPFPIRLGDGSAAAGSPTYDLFPGYVYVGTESGVVYAIQLP